MADKKEKKNQGKVDDGSEKSSDSPWESQEESEQSRFGEGIRKIFTMGLSAAFLTEDSIRSYLSELKLPKEVMGMLLQSAGKSKEQLLNKVASDLASIFGKIDFVKEASRFAENHKFRVSAEIEILKKENGEKSTDLSTSIKFSGQKDDDET